MEKQKVCADCENGNGLVEVQRANAGELMENLTDLIRHNFVATYGREEGALIMRLPNGQTFRIWAEEICV